jgi:siroheme synthase-like protein
MKKLTQSLSYYPVFLKICGMKCVVVGGGQVALRKVRALLEHEANIDVIGPDICSELIALADVKRIRVFLRDFKPEDLQKAFIAIAATDNRDINQQVAEEARRNSVLVNVVDDAESSNFIVPSCIQRGDITIAISTAGRSPALARKIRTKLEQDFGDEYASLVTLINEVRTEVIQQGIEIDGDAWQEAIDLDLLLKLVREGDDKEVMSILLSNLKAKQKK